MDEENKVKCSAYGDNPQDCELYPDCEDCSGNVDYVEKPIDRILYAAACGIKNSKAECLETAIRMSEQYIGYAKNCLKEHYDDYADIQRLVHDLESVRMLAESLLSKFFNGKIE